MMVFSLVMMGAGTLGVQRRHWDMAFTDAAIGFDYPASAYTMMGLVGISGVAAIVGGAIFVLITVVSVFFGKRVGSESRYGTATTRLMKAPPSVEPQGGHAAAGKTRSTGSTSLRFGQCPNRFLMQETPGISARRFFWDTLGPLMP
jgi:cytochrome c oxidase subunit 1